mgnify:CR=1 FL=1
MPTWKTPKLKKLATILLSFKDAGMLLNFLRDLCTLEELEEMSSRWEAAQLLRRGIPYRDIAEKTGLSTTTITRVAHWLHHGEGGYRAALDKTRPKS